jgi:hypothetical protein
MRQATQRTRDQIGGRLAGIECAATRQRLAECSIMFIVY